MTYLFLYTELAGYTLNCFRKHVELHPEDTIHVVHYPVNPEAPFRFEGLAGVTLYDKTTLGLDGIYELIIKLNPALILCSGWADKEYVKMARMLKHVYRFVLCFDNTWRGTIRQRLLLPFARFVLLPLFKWCWVPGAPQRDFALRMGFQSSRVMTGCYATDISLFRDMAGLKEPASRTGRPRRLLCVARYIPEKGYDLLWKAFEDLYDEGFNNWKLWCAGTGIKYDERKEHPGIRHLGFVQPAEMNYLVSNTDIFVLPSYFEPWGMVVQEFAAAGFPMVLSSAVGAGSAFLKPGENGLVFKNGDLADLKQKLRTAMSWDEQQIEAMGKVSSSLAKASDTYAWSASLSKMTAIE